MKSRSKIFSDLHLRKHFLIGILLVIVFSSALAQPKWEDAENYIKQGDAKSLSTFFNKQIDVTFSDETTTYSKKQAEFIIQQFFSKVDPTNFINVQKGDSHANNTKYIVGNMISSNGIYKVFMIFVYKNGAYVLRMIKFEK